MRHRPGFDGLEIRFVLSSFGASDPDGIGGDSSTVLVGAGFGDESAEAITTFGFEPTAATSSMSLLATSPSSDSATTRAVSSVTVTFDREVDTFSIREGDFTLERSADAEGPARSIEIAMTMADESDPSGRSLTLVLNRPLGVGSYRIKLAGLSELAGMDGSRAVEGQDLILGSFRVGSDSLDPTRAVDLGTPTDAGLVHPGRLDLVNHPNASDTYRFSIPSGRDWNLSLDVSAQRDGIALDAVARIYDANGVLVATVDRGKVDAPLDPSSTLRLSGGVYYLSVSGELTGGGADGSYRVQLRATPAAATTSVVGIQAERANPYSTEVTGLTIEFSGAIDPDSLLIDPADVLSLVDGQGRAWPVSLAGLSADRTRASFVLGASLPVGSYQVRLGVGSTLADLSGHVPIGEGLAAGVFGTVEIRDQASTTATDLGVLWARVGSEAGGVVTLADRVAQTRSFTVLAQGSISLSVIGDVDDARFTILDGQGRAINSVQSSGPARSGEGGNQWNFVLDAGTYTLSFESDDPAAKTLAFSLVVKTTSASSLLDSGVGQGTTAGERVIAPASTENHASLPDRSQAGGPTLNRAPDQSRDAGSSGLGGIAEESGDHGTPSTMIGPMGLILAPAGAVPAADHPASGALNLPGETSGATILIGGIPAGNPSASFDVINVVGPDANSGSFSLASNQPGLPKGLLQVVPEGLLNDAQDFSESARTSRVQVPSGRAKAAPGRPGDNPAGAGGEATPDLTGMGLEIDLGWFTRAATWVEQYFEPDASPAPTPDLPTERVEIGAAERSDEAITRTDSASLSAPAILVGTLLAAYRARSEWRKMARRLAGRGEGRRRFAPSVSPVAGRG